MEFASFLFTIKSLFSTVKKWFFTGKEKRSTTTNFETTQKMNNSRTSGNMIQAGDNATHCKWGDSI